MSENESSASISRRRFLRNSSIAALALGLPFQAQAAQSKPNVLFIMTDQHNAHCLGCYGHAVVKTPAMDRIAREGVLFENALCQTGQCVPSRYAIWTGRYPRSTGTYANKMGQNAAEDTVADLFKPHGYVCGTIGKHHMLMNEENANHGFDVVFTGDGARRFALEGDFLPREESQPGRSNCGVSAASNDEHQAGVITAKAIEFLNENKDRPFVLWYSFQGPHSPICPSRPWAEMYDPETLELPPNHKYEYDLKNPKMANGLSKSGAFSKPIYHKMTLAYYLGYVSQIDYNIGRVLDELDKLGLAENTIVVYTADHGEFASEHGGWTKTMCGFDAILRVPMMIRFPGRIPAGMRRVEMAESINLLPTLMDYAGVPIPEKIDGRSFRPLIEGTAADWPEFAISESGGDPKLNGLAIRTATLKYMAYRSENETIYEQLYDLQADPWEMKNIAADPARAADLERMKSLLAEWEAAHPPVPPVAATGLADPYEDEENAAPGLTPAERAERQARRAARSAE